MVAGEGEVVLDEQPVIAAERRISAITRKPV
jgi:hypothetical protein